MKENNSKIIVCDTCYNIPKLVILNHNEVQLECPACGKQIKNISYFHKFKNNMNNEIIDMPKCNYNNNHNNNDNSILYCFQCSKYLCQSCIQAHNIAFKESNHLLINQKIKSNYYCKKEGHKEYILFKYCTLCKDYLCSQCHCNHGDNDIYNFENSENIKKIKDIINKVKICEEIIKTEENKLNNFLKEINKKIEILKTMFKYYKERNLKIISFYKILINNFNRIYNIRNYNINNNIIINNNFDLSNSDEFIKEKDNKNNECLSSIYNKLCAFYNNKLHIKTKQYANYLITQKFCNKNIIKKCIFREGQIFFIFYHDQNIFSLNKENNKEYYIKKIFISDNYIEDIYYIPFNKFISIDSNKNMNIFEIRNNELQVIKKTKYEK